MEASSRKPLSPSFRMALLAGTVASVRSHLGAGSDVNAADEKGRSPLILAASKGRIDLCRLLLDEGADPDIRDHDGIGALAVAEARGQTELASLLAPAATTEPQTVVASGPNSKSSDYPIVAELSDWEEDVDAPPPPDDPSWASGAAVLQHCISHHIPVDTDPGWDDIEIDLPEPHDSGPPRTPFTRDQEQSLWLLLVEGLRDGRLHEDRIVEVLPDTPDTTDDSDGASEPPLITSLRYALADLGVEVDDGAQALDVVNTADEADEDRYGDIAAEAVSVIRLSQSRDFDPFNLYVKDLPTERLTRDDEFALGETVEQGMLEALAALSASPAVLAQLCTDSATILRGDVDLREMLVAPVEKEQLDEDDPTGALEIDGQPNESPDTTASIPHISAGSMNNLNSIIIACRRGEAGRGELVERLFRAGLRPSYLTHLQQVALEHDPEGVFQKRFQAGLARAIAARRRLIETNLRLVIWVAKRHGGLTLTEKIQAGNIGLMHAADRFNHRHGTKFSTYAVWWIKQAINREAANTGRTVRLPVHIHETINKINKARETARATIGREPDADELARLIGLSAGRIRDLLMAAEDAVSLEDVWDTVVEDFPDETAQTPEAHLLANDRRHLIRNCLGIFTERERDIVCRRFGIDRDPQTLEAIGLAYGLTRERIRQIEKQALRKLRNDGRLKSLRGIE